MQRYLHPGDYSIQIRNDITAILTGDKETIMAMAEAARVSFMKGEFARRYDVAKIFRLMAEFEPLRTYAPAAIADDSEMVFYKPAAAGADEYKIYQPLAQTVAGESPETNPLKWQEYGGRNPFVVLKLVDLISYDLHSKHARRAMPETVRERYLEARDWVTRVGDGLIDADLPLLDAETEAAASDIRYNSHEAEDNRW